MIFSFEIAINAKFDTESSQRVVAIKTHILGNYIGFVFASNEDQSKFKDFIVKEAKKLQQTSE
jgi:hypothetical protein